MKNHILVTAMLASFLTACTIAETNVQTPVSFTYTPPEESGLISVRPYPTPADVCQVIGESASTSQFLDDSAILIGCPLHETGAIQDRVAEGGRKVATSGSWVLLSMPDR